MKLVTFKTFSKQIGVSETQIGNWFNKKMNRYKKRPKNISFDNKMIHFKVIDGRRFVDLDKTTLNKETYEMLVKRK